MKPIIFSTPMVQAILDGRKTMTRRIIKPQPEFCIASDIRNRQPLAFWVDNARWVKPRYQPGDILWVRETFCEVPYEYNHIPIKGGHITTPKYAYKADSERDYTGIWRPSIHMPREAARIFLRVANVRVERLQDITEEDAKAEGVICGQGQKRWTARSAFMDLWNRINGKKNPWDTNPWVWVYEFEKISKEEAKRLEGMK